MIWEGRPFRGEQPGHAINENGDVAGGAVSPGPVDKELTPSAPVSHVFYTGQFSSQESALEESTLNSTDIVNRLEKNPPAIS